MSIRLHYPVFEELICFLCLKKNIRNLHLLLAQIKIRGSKSSSKKSEYLFLKER